MPEWVVTCAGCGRHRRSARMFDAVARICWRCHLHGVTGAQTDVTWPTTTEDT